MENINELQEQVKAKMQKIANGVEKELPKGFGFVVLAFPFGKDINNQLMYVSNANREDICKVMAEFIEKTIDNYLWNDIGKY